ncbi:S8 family serine peptidase [Arcicella sp. LKC2W]|uniref:S8 family serine peptidase n=1 Tax=Arcicella sp. LKC2W TaxID=2984198 RepID=UPI002B20FA79|nr:S8 family serine peptidase [Arcicella sp. LKC2W]MEA5460834.1 S8 family serine peptidase [Arcicella sp. LKC2W]
MHTKYLLLIVLNLLIFSISSKAQTAEDRAKIVEEYKAQNKQSKNARQSAETALKQEATATNLKVQAYLQKHPTFKRTFVKNGSFYFLKDIDADGNPVYINTKSNVESGTLIKANQLYSGGTLGVNITGQNMVVGIWDGGQVRATHELLTGKVAMQAGQSLDGSKIENGVTTYPGNDHQTHVSGTIVGKDIANQPSARGIAYSATALNYDFSDDFAEMAPFAAGGYLISNHSYGGANDNTTPLWKFGAYDREAQKWDSLTNVNSYYLPFVAGGNEQSNNGNSAKSGYDLMTGSSASKNAMTVGALNADKSMSTYSNWGPTDDGRVKPEIVTRGTGINSSVFANQTTNIPSDNSYSGSGVESSGTSYAAPAAAASGLLLQQYYKSLYGNYMKAATLKALMLGTAEDLGQAGPDHKFGWGLLNVEKAANVIKAKSTEGNPTAQSTSPNSTLTRGSYMEEITYNLLPYIQTDPNRLEINRWVIARGGEPLIISMAWTDEKGTEQTSANGTDPTTSRLVHEYDMLVRITSPFSDTRPWKPSGMANRTADATVQTGWFEVNNNNYKQVKILNPVAGGEYRIVIRKSATSPATLMPLSLVVTGTAVAPPAAFAQTRCAGQTVANLVATGTDIKWYAASSGGTALATTTVLASGTYYASQTLDGSESSRRAVSVTVNATVTPSVSIAPTTFCAGTSGNLTLTVTNGGTNPTYAWTRNGVAYSSLQNITLNNAIANDVYAVTVTPPTSACANPTTATASITISASPQAPATSPIAYNQDATAVPLVATADANSSLRWYGTSQTGGSASTTAPTPITTNPGMFTYYVSQVNAAGCESPRASLTVTVNAGNSTPAPTGTASQTFCSGKTVADLVATGTAIKWYATVSGGSMLPTNTQLVNGTIYYATQTISNVESAARLAVTATVHITPNFTIGTVTNPTPPNAPDGNIAFSSNLTNGNYTLTYKGVGNSKNVSVAGGAFNLNGLISGIYSAFSINNNGCIGIVNSSVSLTNTTTNVISIATGNWESNTTWNVGRAPQAGDVVIIDAGHTVRVNATTTVKDMTVKGILNYGASGIAVNLGL